MINARYSRIAFVFLLISLCSLPLTGQCDADFQYGWISSIELNDNALPGFDPTSGIAMYGTSVHYEPEENKLALTAKPGTLGGAFNLDACTVTLNDNAPVVGFTLDDEGNYVFSMSFSLKVGQNTFVMKIVDGNGENTYTLLVMRANPPPVPVITLRTLPPNATPHPEALIKSLATVGNTGGSTSVYAAPSTDTGVVGTVTEGEEITLRDWSQDGAWCEIFFNNNSHLGWLPARYIVLWQN